MGELIAVVSGKGGTGKTSVTAGISTALARVGNRILCIDCDAGLRNLDISLGLADSCPLSFVDVMDGNYPLSSAAIHPKFRSLRFLTAPVNLQAQDIDISRFGAFLNAARQQFDYIFLDAPAGVDAGFRLAATYADRCVVVTGPDPAALRDAAATGQKLELMGKRHVRLVVNRVQPKLFKAMGATVDDLMDETGLQLLGIVPEDANVTLAAAGNAPLLAHAPRSAAAKACVRIARRIQGLPESIPFR